MEDGVLDLLLSEADQTKPQSFVDAQNFVRSKIWSWFEKSDSLVAQDIVSRYALKMWMYYSSSSVPEDTVLSKLLKVTKVSEKTQAPLLVVHHENEQQHLTVRVPTIDSKNETQMTNLGHLLSFASSLLGLESSGIHLLFDDTLGTEILISSAQQKLLDSLKSSAQSPKGLFPGDTYSFKSGFKSNLIGLLGAMRILTTKQEFIRKRPNNSPKEPLVVTSYQDLLEMFNIRSGLKTDTLTYSQNFVKNLLNVVVRPSNVKFPGGWLYSVRQQNGVATDTGLLFKLGYAEKVSSHHKLLDVIYNPVIVKDDKKVITLNKAESLSFIEFRSSVALTTPKIDHTSSVPMDKQVSQDPLKIRNPKVLEGFSDADRIAAVDRLNVAYALKVSCTSKKSKTEPGHYEQARNAFLHSTARCVLKDCTSTYQKFSDMPAATQGYLRKVFRYPLQKGKRKAPDTDIESGDMIIDEVDSISSIQPTPKEVVFKKARAGLESEGSGAPLPPPPPAKAGRPRRAGAVEK
jgi:hypothetical protein